MGRRNVIFSTRVQIPLMTYFTPWEPIVVEAITHERYLTFAYRKNHTNFNHSKLCQIPLYYPRLVGLPFNPSNSNRFPSTSKYFTKWYTSSSLSTNFSSSETKSYGLEKMLAVWMASLLLIESWLSSGGNFQWIHSDLRIQGHVHYVLIFLCIYRNNVIIHIKNL